jgi:hypothetical protein
VGTCNNMVKASHVLGAAAAICNSI